MVRLVIFCFFLSFGFPALAQEGAGDYEARLELADQMLEINPPRDQVRSAVDRYIKLHMGNNSEGQQEAFRAALLDVLNYRALERLSRKAYADIFTAAELSAMLEYYSKPEAVSARGKMGRLGQVIQPEIIRMMDQALIRARTQAQKQK